MAETGESTGESAGELKLGNQRLHYNELHNRNEHFFGRNECAASANALVHRINWFNQNLLNRFIEKVLLNSKNKKRQFFSSVV